MTLHEYLLAHWASPLGLALLFTVLLVVLYTLDTLLSGPYVKGVPLLREPPGATRFSLKTRFEYYTNCAPLFREAYDNYSKKGKAVLLPGLGVRTELVLPVSSLRWALSQADDVVSVDEAFIEIDGAFYALGTEQPILDAWQGLLVKTEMSRVLENLCDAMNNELGVAFDEHFGTDTDAWRRIDLQPVVRRIVAQASSRFTVGLPLCRDAEYLDTNLRIHDGMVVNAGVASGSPAVLRPVLGRLSGLPVRLACRKLQTLLTPLLRERIASVTTHAQADATQGAPDEPQDHLQMMMRYAAKECPHELADLSLLSKRVAVASFASMHQTALGVVHMLLNIIGSDAEFHTIAALRSEISQVLGGDEEQQQQQQQQQQHNSNNNYNNNNNKKGAVAWTKAKVAQLVQADSVARETLRLHSFGGRALMRKVVAPGGVVTDGGVALPRGVMFTFLGQPAQTDADSFEDPERYDPFRFSRPARADDRTSFVTTCAEHLPFGHGRHACPGRFLVDFEMKMIMAYVLRNYDIRFPDEYGGKRPENRWLTEALFPPADAAIMVKRRTDSKG